MLKSERTTLNRCADVRALLPELVEGELSEGSRARVAGHLAGCRGCRDEESRYRSALGALAGARAPHPGDLYAGFSRKLALADSRALRFGRQMRLAGATCLLLVVVGIVGAQVVSRLKVQKAVENAVPPQPMNHTLIVQKTQPEPPKASREIPSVPTDERQPKIVVPDNKPEEPKRELKIARRQPKVTPGQGFLDVVDSHGRSAAEQIKERRSRESAANKQSLPKAVAEDQTPDGMIPSQDATVKVGSSKFRVKSSYREDSSGNRTEVHVSISAPGRSSDQ